MNCVFWGTYQYATDLPRAKPHERPEPYASRPGFGAARPGDNLAQSVGRMCIGSRRARHRSRLYRSLVAVPTRNPQRYPWPETPRAGATAYVTLEPCCHWGQTPPCTDALIQAGVARVVIAALDPDKRVDSPGCGSVARSRHQWWNTDCWKTKHGKICRDFSFGSTRAAADHLETRHHARW
jgi:hypothetical protein